MGWLYYRGSARGLSECDQLLVPTAHGRGPWLSMRPRCRHIKRPRHPGPAPPSLRAAVDLAASRHPFPGPGSLLTASIPSPSRAPQRTHRLPKEMTPVEPAAFAAELIARLEKLKLELETRHSLEERLQQIQEVGAVPPLPPY